MSQSGGFIKEFGILILSVVLGLITGSMLAYIGLYSFFGYDVESLETLMLDDSNPELGSVLRWMQLTSSGFGFVLGGFTYLQWNKNAQKPIEFSRGIQWNSWQLFLLAGLIIVFLSPAVTALQSINQMVVFPEFLVDFETAFKQSQTAAEQQIKILLGSQDEVSFLYLLFIMAVLPALGEELIFRVGLQDVLQRSFGLHAGVVLASLLFALVHQQFYNLLPMMFLALVLGYTYAVHKSFALNFFLHFVHNAYTLLTVRLMGFETEKGMIEYYIPEGFSLGLAILISVILIFYFKRKSSGVAIKSE